MSSKVKLMLNFSPPFNELTKHLHKELILDKEITLSELFNILKNQYGDEFEDLIYNKKNKDQFSSFLSIIINGKSFRHDGFLQTLLKNGDDISFLYIYFGG